MKLFLLILEVLVLLLARANQAFSFHRPIVFGDEVDISEVPYFASLTIKKQPWSIYKDRSYICGGSILNKRTILTAAHCCFNSTSVLIRMGSNFLNHGGTVRYAIRALMHPKFEYKHDYDFCLLKMLPIHYSNLRRPIRIPDTDNDVVEGDMLRVVGFGLNEKGQEPKQLMGTYLPKFNEVLCKLFYPILTDRMFCIGYALHSRRTAKGDSGGPAVSVRTGKIHGIMSFGKGERMGPTVVAKVNSVRDWIIDNWRDFSKSKTAIEILY